MMKKFCVSALILLSSSFLSYSQVKTFSQTMSVDGVNGESLTPKVTYKYKVGEDGSSEKHGPLTAEYSDSYTVSPTKVANKYTFSANYKDGMLHGAVSAKHTLAVSNSRTGKSIGVLSFSFTGSFSNGKPNGQLCGKYVDDFNEEVNVNYKNGILVGSYSYLGQQFSGSIKGTLTSDGKLNGKWNVNKFGYDNHEYEFINGVLVSESNGEENTKPKDVEIAKKYAAGKITEEKLREQGYAIVKDCLDLEVATDFFLRKCYLNLDVYGGYDFSDDNKKEFVKIEKIPMMDEAGMQLILQDIESAYTKKDRSFNLFRLPIEFDEKYGMYKLAIIDYNFDHGSCLTEDEYNQIMNKIDECSKSNTYTYAQWLDRKHLYMPESFESVSNKSEEFDMLKTITESNLARWEEFRDKVSRELKAQEACEGFYYYDEIHYESRAPYYFLAEDVKFDDCDAFKDMSEMLSQYESSCKNVCSYLSHISKSELVFKSSKLQESFSKCSCYSPKGSGSFFDLFRPTEKPELLTYSKIKDIIPFVSDFSSVFVDDSILKKISTSNVELSPIVSGNLKSAYKEKWSSFTKTPLFMDKKSYESFKSECLNFATYQEKAKTYIGLVNTYENAKSKILDDMKAKGMKCLSKAVASALKSHDVEWSETETPDQCINRVSSAVSDIEKVQNAVEGGSLNDKSFKKITSFTEIFDRL